MTKRCVSAWGPSGWSWLAALFAAVCLASAASAKPVDAEHVQVELIPEAGTIQPGKPFTVALRLTPDKGWHTYWVNAGDAGLATTIEWKLPAGFKAGAIQWPAPVRLPQNGVVNYGYESEVLLLNRIDAPASLQEGQSVPLSAHVAWLVCADVCIPGEADLTANVQASTGTPASDGKWASAFATARADLPQQTGDWTFAATPTSDGYRLVATPAHAGADWPKGDVYFFSSDEVVVEPGAEQAQKTEGDRHVISLTRAAFATEDAKALHGVLVASSGWAAGSPGILVDTSVGATTTGGDGGAMSGSPIGIAGLAGSVVLALLGGLILNLMPCVFPVLGLKIVGFAQQAGEDRAKVTLHGLAFTAGVLISFWILAGLLAVLRAGGAELGWGFQLQSPGFVFILTSIMLLFALNLSGVFEVGMSVVGIAGGGLRGKSGLAGTFFTGFLATIVATPCSAPFLAPALGAALALPVGASFVVFTAIGIGLSLPYLLLSAFPAAVKILPRPGRWMETFRQVMAFPLYATVAYLVWVLAGQTSEEGLLSVGFGLVVIAMGGWAYGRWSMTGSQGDARFAAAALAVLLLGGGWLGWPSGSGLQGAAAANGIVWDKWSPEAVADLRAKNRLIYVDFTARWCATCQANKKLVFHSGDVLKVFSDKKVATLRADWTNKDPAITAALARYQRSAIPFNLVYKPGVAEPIVLPEILTPAIVLKSIS